MRRTLIDTQCKEGCAAGSWDPDMPTKDIWGDIGGRLMMTSLSALTLEVYYRYLPLYKLDKEAAMTPASKRRAGKALPRRQTARETARRRPIMTSTLRTEGEERESPSPTQSVERESIRNE